MLKAPDVYTIKNEQFEDETERKLIAAYNDDDIDEFEEIWGFDSDGEEVDNSDDFYIDDPNFLITPTKTNKETDSKEQITMTIFILSTIHGKLDFIKKILKHPDIDENVRDSKGVNVLWYAVKSQRTDVLNYLLLFRPKKQIHCIFDPTYLHADLGMNFLHLSISLENLEMTEMILKEAKNNNF